MVRMTLTAFFTAVLLAGCSSSTDPNQNNNGSDDKDNGTVQGGNGANVYEQTFSTNVKNRCTNQSIRMRLDLKIVETGNSNNDKSHEGRHVILNGTGQTGDGTTYELKTVSNMISNSDSDSYPYTETMNANSRLRADGPSGVSYRFRSRMHITYNANGEITAEIDEMDLDCED